MAVTNELRDLGIVRKIIDSEVNPSKPTYWSRHAWSFGEDGDGIVTLRMKKLAQNGREILYGNMTLGAIDALAGVPSFHPGITNEEAAKLALAQDRWTTYQRALIWERIPGIQAAWREAGFAHTGMITLHIPPEHIESGAITSRDEANDVVIVEMHLKDLLLQFGDEYVDVDTATGRDHRPLHVIDGQHRKVSCELDAFLQGFNVFVSILPLGSTYAEAAQLFTEMNVTAEPLKPLHQLFQRYACFIPHREAAKDFADPDDSNISAERARHRRANRRAYRLAMELASQPRSPLYRRLQTMELPNRQLARGCAVTSKKFIEIARSWFLTGSVFEHMPDKDVFASFKTYLRSWKWIANTDASGEYTDDEGWDLTHERATTDPYITRPLPFESVLTLFPMVHGYSRQYEGTLRSKYLEVLTPLKPVDFTDFIALKSGYGLDKDTPKALHAWFAWAITNHVQTGETYAAEQVWNPVSREPVLCKPGRGFFSPPDRETIEGVFEWEESGLVAGNQLKVWMRPYPNLHQKPLVSVKYLDKNDEVLGSSTGLAQATTHHGHALYKHTIQSSFSSASKLQIQLVIRRLHGEAQLQTTHLIKDLGELDGFSVDFGKKHGMPAHWLMGDSPKEDGEKGDSTQPVNNDDGNDDDAGSASANPKPALTVVQVDDHYIMPPPKSNTVHEPEYGKAIVPHALRMVTCPRCSVGMDCTHPNCIGKTVQGYSWM